MYFEPMIAPALIVLATVLFSAFIVFTGLRAPKGRRLWPVVRRLAITLAILLVAVRPGVPGLGDRTVVSTGNDVYIVMDTTGSVAAEDYLISATRLSGMKADAARIVDEFAGAKFSLLTFDTVALVRVPLTTDATAMQSAIDVVQPEVTLYSSGSSISVAAELLASTLAENAAAHPERQRIVFYLGDGEQTNGEEPGSFEASAANTQGGAVFGYGTAEGGRMQENAGPFDDLLDGETPLPEDPNEPPVYIQDRSSYPYTEALSIYSEENLTAIANQLGVDYVHRTTDSPIPVTADDVPGQPETVESRVHTIVELYWIPALAAFALLLWEAAGIVLALVALRRPKAVDR